MDNPRYLVFLRTIIRAIFCFAILHVTNAANTSPPQLAQNAEAQAQLDKMAQQYHAYKAFSQHHIAQDDRVQSDLPVHEANQIQKTNPIISTESDLPAKQEDVPAVKNAPVYWVQRPKIKLSQPLMDAYADHGARPVTIELMSDINGNIVEAIVVRSSGVAAVDKVFQNAVLAAKLSPYQENGVYLPYKATQEMVFDLPASMRYKPSFWQFILMLLVFLAFIPKLKK